MKFGMRIRLVILLMSFVLFGAMARTEDDFRTSAGIDPEASALLIRDLSSGETLVAYNAEKPLIPASIMKCVTTATLLEKRDVESRFHTKVWLTAPVRDGVVEGNIVVEGSGDPSLNSRHVAGKDICAEIVSALKEIGVREIGGRIIYDEDLWDGPAVPPSWMSGDLPHAYGTGSYALNFEDNASGSRSVPNPSAVMSTRLRAALSQGGITLRGDDMRSGSRELLVDHQSAPLDEIMRSCMMRSDNQYAEALLRTYAVACGEKGSTEAGASREMNYWKRHKAPLEGVHIVDGSGLSRQNRVTPEFMAAVLADRSVDPYYASFFPLAGQEGTLRRFLAGTPLDGYVAMKTGSMKGIQCYAGYKLDDDYAPTHVIVVMLNNMTDRTKAREAVKRALMRTFVPGYADEQKTEEYDDRGNQESQGQDL